MTKKQQELTKHLLTYLMQQGTEALVQFKINGKWVHCKAEEIQEIIKSFEDGVKITGEDIHLLQSSIEAHQENIKEDLDDPEFYDTNVALINLHNRLEKAFNLPGNLYTITND